MIFVTPWFLLFSFAVAVILFLVRRTQLPRLILMFATSVWFYIHFAGLSGFLVISALSLFTFCAGIAIYHYNNFKQQKSALLLFICVAPAIITLVYFRFYDFFGAQLVRGLGLIGFDFTTTVGSWLKQSSPVIHLLGVSFFAFEFCHYLIDIYHGEKPLRNPLKFGIFALFYPRLAAGPILRFQQISPQLNVMASVTQMDVTCGFLRISIGFIKKFAFADPAAQLATSGLNPANILAGTDVLWLCLLLYIWIYMDFSAYCDMAIGLARFWGIRLPENFNFPYLATSPSEFWRRWHITLSTYIRDYIYIPLGGGKVSFARKGLNFFVAMSLCGLWHGSAWNFVLWGCAHAFALQVGHSLSWVNDRLAAKTRLDDQVYKVVDLLRTLLGWVATQLFVGLSWILFFFPVEKLIQIARRLMSWF